jgi:hypothetical protein
MMPAANNVACWEAYITADQCVKFHVSLDDGETAATIWSIANMEHIVNQLESEMYGIAVK